MTEGSPEEHWRDLVGPNLAASSLESPNNHGAERGAGLRPSADSSSRLVQISVCARLPKQQTHLRSIAASMTPNKIQIFQSRWCRTLLPTTLLIIATCCVAQHGRASPFDLSSNQEPPGSTKGHLSSWYPTQNELRSGVLSGAQGLNQSATNGKGLNVTAADQFVSRPQSVRSGPAALASRAASSATALGSAHPSSWPLTSMDSLPQSTQMVATTTTDLAPLVDLAGGSQADLLATDSKKKKKMMKKKKKMEKKHKEWKKGKKHKKKKYESKKKKGGSMKKKKGKKMKKKWGMEKKGHKKKGDFKKKKWGHKKKMKKGHKKGKKGHKMLKDKGHKKKGFKKVYHKEEWGKKKKWHDIKREKKWNTKQKKWKKKWHQEKGKKYKGKHMKKYHKKNKHGKKYKKEKKSKYKKHKGEKFKKGHKKKKEEYSKKKEGGKKKKMKKEMKKKKG